VYAASDVPQDSAVSGQSAETKGCCCENFSCISVAGSASIGNLTVRGNETVGGSLTVLGTTALGSPVTIGGCTLACTGTTLSINGSTAGSTLGYGYIYNVSGPTIAIGSPIDFDFAGPLSGVTYTNSSGSIGIVNAGTYAIFWSVSGVQSNQFALTVNGTVSPSTLYGSGAGTQQNVELSILTVGAGATLQLINNVSAAGVTLQTLAGGTGTNVNASVLIIRLA
jgi:hypothetical protein